MNGETKKTCLTYLRHLKLCLAHVECAKRRAIGSKIGILLVVFLFPEKALAEFLFVLGRFGHFGKLLECEGSLRDAALISCR